jgi:macrolide-specific efflux system membrane fusion protein
VTIRFRNYHKEGERVTPAPAEERAEFPPLTCSFAVSDEALPRRSAATLEVDPKVLRVPSSEAGVVVMIGREIEQGEALPAGSLVKINVGKEERTYRRLRVGDRVKRGQLLAVLDDALPRVDLAIELAKREAAGADFLASKATFEEAQAKVDRLAQIRLTNAAAVSIEEYAQAVLVRDRYRHEVVSKQEQIKLTDAQVDRARAILSHYQVRSPVNGTITAVYRQAGEAVGQYEPLFQIRPAREDE